MNCGGSFRLPASGKLGVDIPEVHKTHGGEPKGEIGEAWAAFRLKVEQLDRSQEPPSAQ